MPVVRPLALALPPSEVAEHSAMGVVRDAPAARHATWQRAMQALLRAVSSTAAIATGALSFAATRTAS